MKHMINAKTKCPFYRHEDSQVIYCDGIQEGSVLHLAFASKTNSLDYKKTYCREDYCGCRLYQMLSREAKE